MRKKDSATKSTALYWVYAPKLPMNDKALIESFNELFFLHIHIGGKSSSSRFVLPLTFSPGFCFYLTGFDSSTPESFLLSRGFAEVVTPSPSAFFFDFFTANGFGPLGPFATFFFFTTYLCSPLLSACSLPSSSSSSSSSSSNSPVGFPSSALP